MTLNVLLRGELLRLKSLFFHFCTVQTLQLTNDLRGKWRLSGTDELGRGIPFFLFLFTLTLCKLLL